MKETRDPRSVGKTLMSLRRQFPDKPLHELADDLGKFHIAEYPKDESSLIATVQQYQEELERDAEAGSVHAKDLLAQRNGRASE